MGEGKSASPRVRGVLAQCAAGEIPPNIALMRLHMAIPDEGSVASAVEEALKASEFAAPEATERLRSLAELDRGHPGAGRLIRQTLQIISHDAAFDNDDGVAEIAAFFDCAVRVSPETSVALYALGDPGLLAAASAEIVDWMRASGLVGPGRTILDLGCGIGRLTERLAAEAAFVVGVDVSQGMLSAAVRRCKAPDAAFLRTSGRDFAGLADGSFDSIVAVDCFPYIVQVGFGLAVRHIEDAARILRSRGTFLILNISYGTDPSADARELLRVAGHSGFAVLCDGIHPFSTWDGSAVVLEKA
jgi:SAM-dependent methyltransferase